MNSTREQSMKTFEDLYSEPPPYSSRPPTQDAATSNGNIQHKPHRALPKINELNFQPSPLEIPTPAECIAHLKLLHAFAKLRQDVGNHEGLFGIHIEDGNSSTTNTPDDASLAERLREKRWTIFVTKAVARFEKWWELLYGSTYYSPIRTDTFEAAGGSLYSGELVNGQE